jgi:transmembrane sensor
MTHDPDYLLLDRYVAGECGADERERVERWMEGDASRARLVEWMRGLRPTARQLRTPWDSDALWQNLETRIAERERTRRARAPGFRGILPGERSTWSTHLLRVAAVVALISGSVALWRLAGDGALSSRPVAMRSFTTRPGERAAFNLVDGSRVTLGASSALDVPDDYGRRSRDVYLQGQGYFEVVPDPERPFRVHSGHAVTEVLGTRFGVRAYQGDSSVAVVVAEGRVGLAPQDGGQESTVLTRGDLARLDPEGGVRVERGVDVARYLAWTQGRLEFVNAPLRDVLPELARWYDLDFRLDDSALADRPLTASLGTESAIEMLRLLEASLDVRVRRAGRIVTLQPQRSR